MSQDVGSSLPDAATLSFHEALQVTRHTQTYCNLHSTHCIIQTVHSVHCT